MSDVPGVLERESDIWLAKLAWAHPDAEQRQLIRLSFATGAGTALSLATSIAAEDGEAVEVVVHRLFRESLRLLEVASGVRP